MRNIYELFDGMIKYQEELKEERLLETVKMLDSLDIENTCLMEAEGQEEAKKGGIREKIHAVIEFIKKQWHRFMEWISGIITKLKKRTGKDVIDECEEKIKQANEGKKHNHQETPKEEPKQQEKPKDEPKQQEKPKEKKKVYMDSPGMKTCVTLQEVLKNSRGKVKLRMVDIQKVCRVYFNFGSTLDNYAQKVMTSKNLKPDESLLNILSKMYNARGFTGDANDIGSMLAGACDTEFKEVEISQVSDYIIKMLKDGMSTINKIEQIKETMNAKYAKQVKTLESMVDSVRDPHHVMAAISDIRRVINYQTTGTIWIVAEIKQAITAAEKVAEHATAAYLNR